MQVFPIENAEDHARALTIIEDAWEATLDGPDRDAFEALCALVDAWETRHVPFGPADPIEVIESKLRELNWSQRELCRRLGWKSSGRVSEVLRRKRPLTLAMVHDLSRVLNLPAGLLVHDTRDSSDGDRWILLPEAVVGQAQQAAQLAGLGFDDFVLDSLRAATSFTWRQTNASVGERSEANSALPYGAPPYSGSTTAHTTGATVTLCDANGRRSA